MILPNLPENEELVKTANHLLRIRKVLYNILLDDYGEKNPEEFLAKNKLILPLLVSKQKEIINYEIIFRDEEIRLRPSMEDNLNQVNSNLFPRENLLIMEVDSITERFINNDIKDSSPLNNALNYITSEDLKKSINNCINEKTIIEDNTIFYDPADEFEEIEITPEDNIERV